MDNPIGRKVVWFSFLSGDDIRENCKPGAPDRMRVVYNGRWMEQVRVYEVSGRAPYLLDQRVIGPADLSHFNLDTAIEPLTGKTALSELTAAQYQTVAASLDAAIAAHPPKVDEMMASDSFYWVASACRGGKFTFGAWQYGKPGYAELGFPSQLLAADRTGVAVNPAHDPDSFDLSNKPKADKERWYLRIYADRVGGGIGF
ncbi:MAG TPA: hypothetical protein VM661_08665 [Candidatus Sulfotelmatobacter sp.]|nr:hypothetical protein [Candidatus Sulfotelmatobacter sp.]